MREFAKGFLLTPGLFTLVIAAIGLGWAAWPTTQTMTQATSPNGKWVLSEEFDKRTSCFRIILRDSAGQEIARSTDRLVESCRIDLPSDHQSELEMTDSTAGTKGQPIWRLNAAQSRWHVIFQDEPTRPPEKPKRLF